MKSTTKRSPRLYLGEQGRGEVGDRIDRWELERRLAEFAVGVAIFTLWAGTVIFAAWASGVMP